MFSLNSATKIILITVKGLEPATSCVRDQDATTVPGRHMWETGSSNWSQFMLQWFISFPEFTEFNETSALFRKNSIIVFDVRPSSIFFLATTIWFSWAMGFFDYLIFSWNETPWGTPYVSYCVNLVSDIFPQILQHKESYNICTISTDASFTIYFYQSIEMLESRD